MENTRIIDNVPKKFKRMTRSYIIENYCPYDIDHDLEKLDPESFIDSDSIYGQGCRGMTCEECWTREL